MKRIVQSIAGIALFFLLATPLMAESKQDIIAAIQKKYDATQSFQARFVQKSYLKVMDQTQEARGEVFIKKPGKMKWTYNAPDPQVLISNNKLLWLYLPEESQVTRMKVDSIYSSNTPALFLSGEGKLTESFNVGEIQREDGNLVVELIPKTEEQGLDRLLLVANQNNFQIVGSSVYDKLGNRTQMMFTDIENNPGISDSQFQFEVPPGVELIDLAAQP
ncbi:outer membrane lipoprotein chaperone LolA [Nitrospina gracilis]|uniref:outer membrane lipoprotein chaperone LolA n=1 Tax=Nitrospina gracilis TaxID=35801 RepID=UPI001F01BBB5|nr:outer membrane lipoprotein chaperone LolA [Nitrospina gracilis]MCF8720245.1 outer membrane lipoprotein carrier protein [Nitrospina gracilis Nb-211]